MKQRFLLKVLAVIILVYTAILQSPAVVAESDANQLPKEFFLLKFYNRSMFTFNHWVDTLLFKPIAQGYDYMVPNRAQVYLTQFSFHKQEPLNMANLLLQAKFKQANISGQRFVINTLFGLGGFIDVAKEMGLEKQLTEDFGQTLAAWGIGSGAYIVLPFLGPSSLRDSLSQAGDYYLNPLNQIDQDITLSVRGAEEINRRASFLGSESLVVGSAYEFRKQAYLQYRRHLILDGEPELDENDSIDWLDDLNFDEAG